MPSLATAITRPDPTALEDWLDNTPDRSERERQLRELAALTARASWVACNRNSPTAYWPSSNPAPLQTC